MSDPAPTASFLNPDDLPPPNGYSHVVDVVAARVVYVSGQVPLDAGGGFVGAGNFEVQARQCFANVGRALTAAGLGFEHVVKLGLFVTDIAHLTTLRRVRDEFIDDERPPASTLVQVAALFRADVLVEVEAVAVVPA
jgi:reactive intermediate/imine deaminase